MKSDVYFIEAKEADTQTRSKALDKLLHESDPFSPYREGEFIPVKLTVGDTSCVHHVAPELVKLIVARIKQKKAKPFLFDTNVIYKGSRQNAVDHLNLVQSKGFGQSETGAPFMIADGVLGQDGRTFKIASSLIDRIRVPSFIGVLDSLLVLSHVTGHMMSGYAGAIKNVAMGMACRATKQVQHSSVKPHVIIGNCTACGACIEICPVAAISYKNDRAFIDKQKCIGCGECLCVCNFGAISVNWEEDSFVFCRRMAEVSKFILSKFKNKFFINFVFDVTYECDCISTKNEKIISHDIGIVASEDAVSVDKASMDLAKPVRNEISNTSSKNGDIFARSQLRGAHKKMLEYAGKIGLGSLGYNLVKL